MFLKHACKFNILEIGIILVHEVGVESLKDNAIFLSTAIVDTIMSLFSDNEATLPKHSC